jgi:hypothetical protein
MELFLFFMVAIVYIGIIVYSYYTIRAIWLKETGQPEISGKGLIITIIAALSVPEIIINVIAMVVKIASWALLLL